MSLKIYTAFSLRLYKDRFSQYVILETQRTFQKPEVKVFFYGLEKSLYTPFPKLHNTFLYLLPKQIYSVQQTYQQLPGEDWVTQALLH